MKDLVSNIGVINGIAPVVATNGAVNGKSADLADFYSAAVVFSAGVVTDGTHTPKVQESDDDTVFTDVAAADLLGSLVDMTSDSVQKIGYKGSKRYIRGVSTGAGATTGAVISSHTVLGTAREKPVA